MNAAGRSADALNGNDQTAVTEKRLYVLGSESRRSIQADNLIRLPTARLRAFGKLLEYITDVIVMQENSRKFPMKRYSILSSSFEDHATIFPSKLGGLGCRENSLKCSVGEKRRGVVRHREYN